MPLNPVEYKAMVEQNEVRQHAWSRVVGTAVRDVENFLLKDRPGFLNTTYFGAI